MDFSAMRGVVNSNSISIKVDRNDAPARLSELKDKLIHRFNLPVIGGVKWERKRKVFLDKVLSIEYTPLMTIEAEDSRKKNVFSPEELRIFSKWANNTVDKTYMVMRGRAGLEVHFGYHNGYTFTYGEEEAELEDFMHRLQDSGYIKVDRYDPKNRQPIYKITKQGFEYAKTIQ